MKNNYIKFFVFTFLFNFFFILPIKAIEPFEFDVTFLEILENGNIIKGSRGGTAFTNDKNTVIKAENFEYDKTLKILNAKGNVEITDLEKKIILAAPKIIYLKNTNQIFTEGLTKINLEDKYDFVSEDVLFNRKKMTLSSTRKTKIIDSSNTIYEIEQFKFLIESKILKGNNISIKENLGISKNDSDYYFFKNGIFNLENKTFKAADTKIELKKNIFENLNNDPRIIGISSYRDNDLTVIEKGVFTSCAKNNSCPPWSVQANKIIHNKKKKQLIYDQALLKVYDFPVMYFPKFFHPDPTVKRQSGFLQPRMNNSNTLGTSFTTPYFYIISENKDITFKPTVFDSDMQMLQAEFRNVGRKSNFIADIGLINNFKSTISEKKNSISHFFSKLNIDFDIKNFDKSRAEIFFEKVTNDSYLNIFDTVIVKTPSKPSDSNLLKSGADLYLDNNELNLNLGFSVYENLRLSNSDRYQYVLPYYNFSKNLYTSSFGNLNLISDGSNDLNQTNNLNTSIINSFEFYSNNKIFNKTGLINNFEAYFKNINTVGKKSNKYKSSPKIEVSNIYVFNSSLPMIKNTLTSNQILTPKISFKINPSEMLNYKSLDRRINNSNIFSANRLGLNDTYESGKSLTVGVDFNSRNIENQENYFDLKLATVLRDKEEKNIPSSSTIDKKNSNLFGLMKYNFSEYIDLNYSFALDNKYEKFESNNFGVNLKLNNFKTSFNFIEENGNSGNTNILENQFSYKINENNSINFETRRNRKINLTEYYDLIYEYKNDCLIAGLKYKKTYYQYEAIKPSEDLMFTLTIYPITTLEQKVNSNLY